MKLLKKRCGFPRALRTLAESGFTREYADTLREELSEAERPADIAKGQSFLANALLIIGDLTEARQVFDRLDMKRLEQQFRGNLVSNMIFLEFVRDNFGAAEELYQTYNREVLGEHSEASKRSLAIHQHIMGRYDVSLEIYAKMLNSESGSQCRFLDICMVKSMLRLDMYQRAEELTALLERYEGCGELGAEVQKLEKKVRDGSKTNKPKKKKPSGK